MSRADKADNELTEEQEQFVRNVILTKGRGTPTQRRAQIRRALRLARCLARNIRIINTALENNQLSEERKEIALLLRELSVRSLKSPTYYAIGVEVDKDGKAEFLY